MTRPQRYTRIRKIPTLRPTPSTYFRWLRRIVGLEIEQQQNHGQLSKEHGGTPNIQIHAHRSLMNDEFRELNANEWNWIGPCLSEIHSSSDSILNQNRKQNLTALGRKPPFFVHTRECGDRFRCSQALLLLTTDAKIDHSRSAVPQPGRPTFLLFRSVGFSCGQKEISFTRRFKPCRIRAFGPT